MSTIVFVKPSELTISDSLSSIFAVNRAMVDSISESMKATGYDYAFPVVCSEVGGYVVDGHTRVAAAKKARVCTIPVIFRRFADELEAVEYAIRCQRNRRNLTDAELLRCIAEVDKRRKPEFYGNQHTDGQASSEATPQAKSADTTAAIVGTSRAKVERARTVIDHAPPEVKAKLDTGELTINAAYKATQAARKGQEPQADANPVEIQIDPAESAYDRYDKQLRAVATAKAMSEWPTIAKAMEDVAAWLRQQTQ